MVVVLLGKGKVVLGQVVVLVLVVVQEKEEEEEEEPVVNKLDRDKME